MHWTVQAQSLREHRAGHQGLDLGNRSGPVLTAAFDPTTIDRDKLSDLIHENARGWYALLLDADAAVRPAPHVWSRLEYGCHVRDVHRIFAERVR